LPLDGPRAAPGPSINAPARDWLADAPPPTSPAIDLRGDRDEYGLYTSGPKSPWWHAAGQHAYYRAARGQEMQEPLWLQPPPAPPEAADQGPASPLANFQAGIDAWKADHGMTPTWQPPPRSRYWNAAHGLDVGPPSQDNWSSAQAHAQQMANRALGLNGIERYHFFPERWFIDPFRNAAAQMQAGVPVIDPQTGQPDPRYVENAWDIASAAATGAPKVEGAAGIFGGRLRNTGNEQPGKTYWSDLSRTMHAIPVEDMRATRVPTGELAPRPILNPEQLQGSVLMGWLAIARRPARTSLRSTGNHSHGPCGCTAALTLCGATRMRRRVRSGRPIKQPSRVSRGRLGTWLRRCGAP
jgi:hypothetical protein